MKRTPLRRTGYMRRTGRLPKAVSDKRRAKIDELDAVTPALLERVLEPD